MSNALTRLLAYSVMGAAVLGGSLGLAQAAETFEKTAALDMHHHFFFGKWNCTGQVTDPHDQSQIDTVGQLTIKKQGKLVVDHFHNYMGNGKKFSSMGWTHYDDLNNNLVRYSVSRSGAWGRSVSQGWQKDDFTWEGKVNAFGHRKPIWINSNAHKTGDKAFTWTIEVSYDQGGWEKMYAGTCSKVSHDAGHDSSSDNADSSDHDGSEADAGTSGDNADWFFMD